MTVAVTRVTGNGAIAPRTLPNLRRSRSVPVCCYGNTPRVRSRRKQAARTRTMLLHYLRAGLANLRIRKQTAVINVIGLTLGLTCFVIAYVMSAYLASADRHFAKSDRIYVIQERVVAPGEDTANPFFTSTPPA